MPDIDELFKGMKEAKMFGRGNYMAEGNYEVDLKNMFVKKRFKGGHAFICEFDVAESDSDKHKPGSSGSWAPKLDWPNTFGNIKSLIFAALNIDPKTVKEEDAGLHAQADLLTRAVCGSASAISELKAAGIEGASILGRRVHLECTKTKTKEGGDFTLYNWTPSKTAGATA